MQQKAQEDIHPVGSSHDESPKQAPMKPRKRHSRPLHLTGEVNLGTGMKRERKQRPRKRPVIEQPLNTIDEVVTNPGRHHHHHQQLPNEIPEIPETTPTPATTTEEPIIETTQEAVEKTTISEAKLKLNEKAHRRERLKQKLALLTPEERQAFLLMKQQRADAKKKGINAGH